MSVIGYARVSTDDQSAETQRHHIESRYKVDKWYTDEAVSGTVKASERSGFKSLMDYVREGDVVVVYAIDRLGRDTVDVLSTVEILQEKGATIISMREGFDLSTDYGKLMLTMLAALAELERKNIKARQMAGIERAKAEGRASGREKTINDLEVFTWREENNASIRVTADHFGISLASVKRACKTLKESLPDNSKQQVNI